MLRRNAPLKTVNTRFPRMFQWFYRTVLHIHSDSRSVWGNVTKWKRKRQKFASSGLAPAKNQPKISHQRFVHTYTHSSMHSLCLAWSIKHRHKTFMSWNFFKFSLHHFLDQRITKMYIFNDVYASSIQTESTSSSTRFNERFRVDSRNRITLCSSLIVCSFLILKKSCLVSQINQIFF